MLNVEAEVNKHRTCKDRDELERRIKEYKSLALKNASNIVLAGQYSTVAHKLQEICDKLPAPRLNKLAGNTQRAPVKTANITSEENTKIKAEWDKKAGSTRKDDKR